MQVLISTGTVAGSQPIYLPYDKAPVPFGDPLGASLTAATPSIITVPGYVPTVNDAVSITVEGGNGILATQVGAAGILQLSTTYYVSGVSAANAFTLGTQKGTATSLASWTTLGFNITTPTIALQPIAHLLSNQVDGTTIPFKPGNTVVAWNAGTAQLLGTGSFVAINLLGASDLSTVYGNPIGPGTWNVIATVGFGAPKLVTINYDWIVASNSTATLVLLQN
jgi:hypothetical protein